MPRQRLGQHFLSDSGWQQRILATLPLHAGDSWIEIGAGHGEMTHLLAGGERRVIAIETDPALAASLSETAETNPSEWPRVEIVNADVLAVDFARMGPGPFHVYGNLPYYITSPILRRLFDNADRISSIHIVIQLEVAERIVAQPGSRAYGYLSTLCQLYTKPGIVLRLPPGAIQHRTNRAFSNSSKRALVKNGRLCVTISVRLSLPGKSSRPCQYAVFDPILAQNN
jgi:16S rRNA (adenine1518-N6/adenine1519-N6)-dimethyltransferase